MYGTEIVTLGGSRGPSVSYYVPYLSAMQLLLPVPPAAHTPSMPQQQQQPAGFSGANQAADQLAQASFSQQQSSAQRSSSQQRHGDDASQQTQQGIGQQRPAVVGQGSAGSRPSRVYQVENDGQVCFEQSISCGQFAYSCALSTLLAAQLVPPESLLAWRLCCLQGRLHAYMADQVRQADPPQPSPGLSVRVPLDNSLSHSICCLTWLSI